MDCAVFGVADDRLGQRVAAAVEGLEDSEDSRRAILVACDASLARYKVPAHVVVVDRLPRNQMGKVNRAELPRLLGDSLLELGLPGPRSLGHRT